MVLLIEILLHDDVNCRGREGRGAEQSREANVAK